MKKFNNEDVILVVPSDQKKLSGQTDTPFCVAKLVGEEYRKYNHRIDGLEELYTHSYKFNRIYDHHSHFSKEFVEFSSIVDYGRDYSHYDLSDKLSGIDSNKIYGLKPQVVRRKNKTHCCVILSTNDNKTKVRWINNSNHIIEYDTDFFRIFFVEVAEE